MTRERQAFVAVRWALRLAAAALIGWGAAASADGVVVDSSSSHYDRGDRVVSGRDIRLEAGARVAVMAPSGDVHRFAAPGGTYRDEGGDGGRGSVSRRVFGAAGQVLAGAEDGERIGATRGENFCDDAELPVAQSVACGQDAPEARLEAWLLEEDGRLAPGEPLRYALDATVDLEVLCEIGEADGSWRPAGGAMSDGPVRLAPGMRVLIPRRGALSGAMPTPGGAATLRCYGVDPQTWELLEPQIADDATSSERFTMAAVFADARDALFLQTRIAFSADEAE